MYVLSPQCLPLRRWATVSLYNIYILTFFVVCSLGSIYSYIQCLPPLRSLYFRPESLTSSASCWILKAITYIKLAHYHVLNIGCCSKFLNTNKVWFLFLVFPIRGFALKGMCWCLILDPCWVLYCFFQRAHGSPDAMRSVQACLALVCIPLSDVAFWGGESCIVSLWMVPLLSCWSMRSFDRNSLPQSEHETLRWLTVWVSM